MTIGRLDIVNVIDRASGPVDSDGFRSLRRDDIPDDWRTPVAAYLGLRGVNLERVGYVFAPGLLYSNPGDPL